MFTKREPGGEIVNKRGLSSMGTPPQVALPITTASILVKLGGLIIISTFAALVIAAAGEIRHQLVAAILMLPGVLAYLIGIGISRGGKISVLALAVCTAGALIFGFLIYNHVFEYISLALFSFITIFLIIPASVSLINWRHFH